MANSKTNKPAENTAAENDNLYLYNQLRSVPKEAQKQFNNGKFSGTDINPMWRIKRLTEVFGVCGEGWKWGEPRWNTEVDGEVKTVHCTIALYWRMKNGEWSEPVWGVGGNTISSVNKSGYKNVSDEGYKMAFTDAQSNAAKQLGLAADIWFEKDAPAQTKYTQQQAVTNQPPVQQPQPATQQPRQAVQQPAQAVPTISVEDMEKAVLTYYKYNEPARKFYTEKGMSVEQVFDSLVKNKRLDAIGNIIEQKILDIIHKEQGVTDAVIVVMDEATILRGVEISDKKFRTEVETTCRFFNDPANSQHVPFYEAMIGHPLGDCIANECHVLYSALKNNKLIA